MTLDFNLYDSAPRSYAIALVEDESVNLKALFFSCLKFMSHQDVKDMLDDNELSPRFFNQDTEED